MNKLFTLAVLLKAVDHLSGPLRAAGRAIDVLDRTAGKATHLQELGKGMQSMGREAVVAGALVAGSLLLPIKAMSDLEDATLRAKVAFLTARGVDPAFTKVEQQAIRLGNRLPGTTADFLQMAAALKETNVSALGIARGGLEATAYLRVLLGNIAPEEAARMLGTFRQSLGIAESDFVKFVDLVQRAKFGFGLDPADFLLTAKYVAPIAQQLGIKGLQSSKSMLAFAGALSQAGIKGETLGTALRASLLALPGLDAKIKGSAEVSRVLEQAGIQLQFFRHGKFLGLENFIAQLGKLKSLTQQQRLSVLTELFGTESASALALVAQKGVEGYRDALRIMQEQASTQQRIDEVLSSFRSIWEAATGTITNTLAAFGATMGPELKGLVNLLNRVSEALGHVIAAHPVLAKWIGLVTLGVGAVLVVFGGFLLALGSIVLWAGYAATGLGKLMGVLRAVWRFSGLLVGAVRTLALGLVRLALAAWTAIVPAVTAAAAAVWSFTAALLANPITWIVLAVIALAAAVYLVYKNWEPISAFFRQLWADIKGAFADAIAWLTGLNLSEAGRKILTTLWNGMKAMASKPVELMREIAGKIRDFLPFSPAKVGPLRDLGRVRIIETIADTMRARPMVAAMRTAASATLAAGLAVAPAPALAAPLTPGSARVGAPTSAVTASGTRLEELVAALVTEQRELIALQRRHAQMTETLLSAIRTELARNGRGDY